MLYTHIPTRAPSLTSMHFISKNVNSLHIFLFYFFCLYNPFTHTIQLIITINIYLLKTKSKYKMYEIVPFMRYFRLP